MTVPIDDGRRSMIPRWRDSQRTIALGELGRVAIAPPAPPSAPGDVPSIVLQLRKDYERSKTPAFAGDLLSTAISLGRPDLVRDVADDVLKWNADRFPSLARLAKSASGLPVFDEAPGVMISGNDIDSHPLYPYIHRIKQRLRVVPRSAFDWMDAALSYESLGQQAHAERAVTAALSLARSNRFVVRSAATFWAHRGDGDRAHSIVVTTPGVTEDPWLLAAEIATADAAERSTRLIRQSKQWVESGHLHPFHASELASAIATIELKAGATKRARRLFRTSLRQPTENAVAQAAWVDRKYGLTTLWEGLDTTITQTSPEASAIGYANAQQWDDALGATGQWLVDQPFSARPAITASFIYTAVKDDAPAAINVCRFGLRSNPMDVVLRNNLAFALALEGHLDEAEAELRQVHPVALTAVHRGILWATHGLIAFRRGYSAVGRVGYQQAIKLFQQERLRAHELRARLLLAMEERRSGAPEATSVLSSVIAQAKQIKDSALEADIARAERQLGLESSRGAQQ